ncbi:MAG: hypothetical protein IKQ97_04315 [Eubacterium sp.]|nr:hypothetical protein [Eubacterium sp.]
MLKYQVDEEPLRIKEWQHARRRGRSELTMGSFFKNKTINKILRGSLMTVAALGFGGIVSGAMSRAACCEVRSIFGETKLYDTFSEGWCYAVHTASTDPLKMTTVKLLANWEASKSKTNIKVRGKKYSIGKYNLGTDLERKHVEGLDNSSSEIDGFSGGHLNVRDGKKITIDLNGFNIDRKRGNDQNDDGELINVSGNAYLRIIDSNPTVAKTIDGVGTTGGALMGGASEDGAGCIHIKDGGSVRMEGGNVCCNQTNDHGGAFKTDGGSAKLFLDGVHVFHNKTRDAFLNTNGGAIYADGGRIRIRNCVFRENKSEDYGGAIFSDEGNSYIVIEDSQFIGNEAKDDGGAVYIDRGSLRVKNTSFDRNKAGDDGGGVYINDEDGAVIRECTFVNNSANDAAGGLYINDDDVFLVECDFHNNYAGGYGGGGIYVDSMHRINVQGIMKVYDNKGKKNRADDLFLQKGKATEAHLYSGGLLDGSKIGVRTNKKFTALKNITQYEFEECFFSDTSDSLVKKNVKSATDETILASVFTDAGTWIMILMTLLILAGAAAGLVYRKRKRRKIIPKT